MGMLYHDKDGSFTNSDGWYEGIFGERDPIHYWVGDGEMKSTMCGLEPMHVGYKRNDDAPRQCKNCLRHLGKTSQVFYVMCLPGGVPHINDMYCTQREILEGFSFGGQWVESWEIFDDVFQAQQAFDVIRLEVGLDGAKTA